MVAPLPPGGGWQGLIAVATILGIMMAATGLIYWGRKGKKIMVTKGKSKRRYQILTDPFCEIIEQKVEEGELSRLDAYKVYRALGNIGFYDFLTKRYPWNPPKWYNSLKCRIHLRINRGDYQIKAPLPDTKDRQGNALDTLLGVTRKAA